MMTRVSIRAFAVLVAVAAMAQAAGPEPGALHVRGMEQLRAEQEAFAAIAEKVAPSVVAISAKRKLSSLDEFGDTRDEYLRKYGDRLVPSAGSGLIIDATGYVLTNEHVVEGAEDLVVVLANRHRFPAKIVSSDPRSDLAVIKIEAKDLPAATFGDLSAVKQGHWAIAMGNPFGLAGEGKPAMTTGIVSAIGRALPNFGTAGDRHYGNLIQTSAAINPGNSGGPLLNLEGQVIGINTAISSRSGVSEGVGFAVPITPRTKEIIAQLKAGKKVEYGFLGVVVRSPNPKESTRAGAPPYVGAIIDTVESDTPADKAKLKAGDIVIQVDEDTVEDSDHLVRAIGGSPIGRAVPLVVWRDKKKITVQVVLEKRSAMIGRRNGGESDKMIWRGMTLADISDDRRKALGLMRDAGGIEVLAVADRSPAAAAGIKVGDVFERIDHKAVKRMADARRAIDATEDTREINVVLVGGVAKAIKPGRATSSRKE
ncbi:MAG: trypsin-like peptidase domain-containing protein [Phycisphaerae bacterium]|nr:trypsin-like peptidase domain-containing protein [Phycisphaerae bacterium]